MIDDVDRIMAVMATAFDTEYGEAWTRRQVEGALLMGNCHVILVDRFGNAPYDSEPAAGFAFSRSTMDEEELLLFAVDPKFQNRGLGARMLALLFENTRHRGACCIHLEMRQGNPAENLYRRYGFVPVGKRPNYYRTSSGQRVDAITFRCDL